jgi:hypothetical protein
MRFDARREFVGCRIELLEEVGCASLQYRHRSDDAVAKCERSYAQRVPQRHSESRKHCVGRDSALFASPEGQRKAGEELDIASPSKRQFAKLAEQVGCASLLRLLDNDCFDRFGATSDEQRPADGVTARRELLKDLSQPSLAYEVRALSQSLSEAERTLQHGSQRGVSDRRCIRFI